MNRRIYQPSCPSKKSLKSCSDGGKENRGGCELLSKKLPLDWFTGHRLKDSPRWMLWIAFKKTTFGLIYRCYAGIVAHVPVVNCFQKNYLWTDLQAMIGEKRSLPCCELLSKKLPLDWFTGVPGSVKAQGCCELLSKKLPLDWFTGLPSERVASDKLWIAFKKTTFGLIYRKKKRG